MQDPVSVTAHHGHRTTMRRAVALFVASLLAAVGALLAGAMDPYVAHVASDRPLVALTFDDGLNEANTREIAEILERYEARGTFFVVGQTIEPQAALARRLIDRGHLLANHSYRHARPSRLDLRYSEVARAQDAFRDTTGVCPRFFRPPWGVQTPFVNAAVRRAGMQTVMWNVEVDDWYERDPQRLAARVLERIQPGAIVLLHDGEDGVPGADRWTQVAALPAILEGLRARGLTAVRLDELLGTSGYLDRC